MDGNRITTIEKVDYRSVAREVMKRLAYEVEESVYLNIPNGTHSIIIERMDSPLKIRVIDNLGTDSSFNWCCK